MKLSSKEKTILAAAELRPHASVKLLQRESGYREHTVRYALRSLEQRAIISPIPFVDLLSLGFNIYNIFFLIGAQKKSVKESLLKTLSQRPEVVWIGEFGGEYQYGIAVCVRHLSELITFMRQLSSKFEGIFFDKAVSCQFSVTSFGRGYLSSKKFSSKPLTVGQGPHDREIDDIDEKVLAALATNGALSHRQIAIKIQMPLSSFELRVKKLTDSKVLAGFLYAIDCTRFGMQSFKLLIYGKGINPNLSAKLNKFCSLHRNVTYLIECLGEWDYEVGAEVESPEEVTALIQELYEQFGSDVSSIKLLSKFRDVKYRWFPGY